MESRHDSENAERILYNMRPKELVSPRAAPTLPTRCRCGESPGTAQEVCMQVTENYQSWHGMD